MKQELYTILSTGFIVSLFTFKIYLYIFYKSSRCTASGFANEFPIILLRLFWYVTFQEIEEQRYTKLASNMDRRLLTSEENCCFGIDPFSDRNKVTYRGWMR